MPGEGHRRLLGDDFRVTSGEQAADRFGLVTRHHSLVAVCGHSPLTTECMTPESWQQIDKLLEQALEQESGNRNLFLDGACGGDDELRREVETLLTAHDQGGSLLSSPVRPAAASKPLDPLQSLVGQSLSHYQTLSRLGEGGMGIVYKARDTHLDRFVAIKVLPPELVADPDRKRRFVQEAKAASALNHPNIITIHDIASENGGISW